MGGAYRSPTEPIEGGHLSGWVEGWWGSGRCWWGLVGVGRVV